MPLSRERVRLLRRISTRKGREKEAVVLVEGPRALGTAVSAGARLEFVLVEEGSTGPWREGLLGPLVARGLEAIELPPREFRELSDAETPQGIAAVAREPRPPLPEPGEQGPAGCLVLDRVRDPGNAGTLVRAAAAFGVGRVLALDGTVDIWNPKAVRASAGLAFHLPIHRVAWAEAGAWFEEAGVSLLVADAGGVDLSAWIRGGKLPDRWALLIGNEAEGAREEARAAAEASLAIPLAPGVDSLNAAMAGTVLLWALGPGRHRPGDAPTHRPPRSHDP